MGESEWELEKMGRKEEKEAPQKNWVPFRKCESPSKNIIIKSYKNRKFPIRALEMKELIITWIE